MSNPTLAWEKLGNQFYRSFEGYTMQWDIDLAQYLVASAPCGGAIAVTRDPLKAVDFSRVHDPSAIRQTSISIYSGSGNLIHKIPWDNGTIRGLGWTRSERLVVVSDAGNARCYHDFDGGFFQFTLGRSAELHGIVDCCFDPAGFVALLKNGTFVSVGRLDDGKEPTIKTLGPFRPPPPPQATPESEFSFNLDLVAGWQLLAAEYDLGQPFEVILAYESNLYMLDVSSCRLVLKDEGPFVRIEVSPKEHAHMALVTSSGRLWIVSADLQTQVCQHTTGIEASQISQVCWCGPSAVALVSEGATEVNLFGLEAGHALRLYFDEPLALFAESSGMRILTSTHHDFFCLVPDSVVDIFRLGSTSPGAILRDCVDQLGQRSPKADENLLIIKSHLRQAVDACISAAGHEFEPYWQKKLLRAAGFGKAAIAVYDSDRYVQMCDYLRVLNSVRQFDVGLLISIDDLAALTPRRLVQRLLTRRMHALAFKTSQYLGLPLQPVYIHWTCSKIKHSVDASDEDLLQEISARLSPIPGISYDEIANTAYEEGRTKLAVTFLMEYERSPDKQVPLLMGMQQHDLALAAAVKSLDVDLVVYVLVVLQRKFPLAAFFRLINDKPLAAKCFEMLCQDKQLLESFLYQEDRQLDIAYLHYNVALKDPDLDRRLDLMNTVREKFKELKALAFESKQLQDESMLYKTQAKLESEYERPFMGLTVSETIATLLRIAQVNRAHKVKDEFKVPDKRFCWIRLKVLVERRDWDGLYAFATVKKTSPIGFEPFYHECMNAGSKRNAARYVSLCTNLDPHTRIQMCLDADDAQQAAQEAFKAKDLSALRDVRTKAGSAVQAQIDGMISSLTK